MKTLALILIGLLAAAAALFATVGRERLQHANTWQRLTSPGKLSKAHSLLEEKCSACHTAVKGVEAAKCIACHANSQSILQRMPTAFHANIAECSACHLEHQGRVARTTQMDHVALAHIGCKMLEKKAPASVPDMAKVQHWLERTNPSARSADHRAAEEALLNCAACHSTKDKHFGFFGADCTQCHTTAQWTISEFRHPSAASRDCAQCHQAPPSHFMEHFQMISMKVAGIEHATVEQCFVCHQTTSWNDIKGLGFYKHH